MSIIKGIITKTTAPTVSNDNTKGFFVGFKWTDSSTNIVYEAISVATGAAVWEKSNQEIGIVASGTNTYTATVIPSLTTYVINQAFLITFTNANTTTSTLNLNGLGAKAIKRNGTLALNIGDILSNQSFWVCYNGVDFQLIGRVSTDWIPPTIPLGAILTSGASFFINGVGIGAGVYLALDGASDDIFFFNDSLAYGNIQYEGSNIKLRMHGRISTNGGVGDNLKFNVNYAFVKDGDNSSTLSTTIAEQTVDVSAEVQDIQFDIDLGVMVGAANDENLMMSVQRNATGAGSDTYTGQWEITGLELVKV